ncbi:hypothetical protein PSN45_002721 [Yamadazyma tenuis]|uniref:BZIP domain-containing protein n=1 Tax=Candida tenuis (strain ATCC 10573 / BCRC 21748 / CBS 615 / JCM 9827 / NBRC 10315 / NRRL Y-1498 / VKM Y-70) TaxID=590646 RepID=G3AX15_CANTC|nr:uncharacterized protein CANTEDRAFT_112386 [Yamadazyma tenuis ATCC 10573]XP_006684129.1 uncharacterized protein CANTEDRAFT_112386 [Yamadazyma tenuis ATCC 10573]EGV66870.1 hypothetical protein CANTEDRAFT_112386 [Yamadazyma tenuis ATCC 10573]EGV66871.1 hypothetical protein CANTEDRAFT_112386 [Yamadazyma tenuis ATCC 10573]WEJ95208.1 hypothetical protein PSN45_002721 [Yamadazyma tenuis]
MNFKPSDYLSDLNLDFNENISLPTDLNAASDLDLFSKNDFYNLDFKEYKAKIEYNEDSPMSLESLTSVAAFNSTNADTNSYVPQTPVLDQTFNNVKVDAANEDKRKRNTAASARFRIKKKMKEQQMEAKSKELQEKVQSLEKKLMTLTMENKCLKSMILKKNEEQNIKLLESIKKRSITDSKPLFEYTK